jgi:lipopolysaccharide transport system permease protein
VTGKSARLSAGQAGKTWYIESTAPTVAEQVVELWRFRHLFLPLAEGALRNVYRSAVLGLGWMTIQPLAMALPAAFVIGSLLGVSVDPVPLPLFILVGVAGWMLFRRSVQWMTKSTIQAQSLLKRVYVPPLVLMAAAVSPALFQFLVVLVLVIVLALYYGPIAGVFYVNLGWHVLLIFPAMVLSILLAFGLSCVTSVLNLIARDTWLTLRYILSGWMLLTPIFYPLSIIPSSFRWIAYLNPLTPIVELYRVALLGHDAVPWAYVVLAAAQTLAVLLAGIWFFVKQRDRIFDT